MLTPVLREGLSRYDIGAKIRSLRLRKRMGLVELGRHSGLSPALLSKIERSLLFPPLPTLLRIAMVFSVGLEHFFVDDPKRRAVSIVRRRERKRLPERPGAADVSFWFESLDFAAQERRFNAYLADFEALPPGKAREHAHPGAELIYVLSGRLALRHLGQEHLLDAGDAAYFDSSLPHAYRRAGRPACRAMVVTSP